LVTDWRAAGGSEHLTVQERLKINNRPGLKPKTTTRR
jgi:hypothetical protein